MTKRFTPKASDYTAQLGDVQAKLAKLKKQVADLEAEERSLKAFLIPFYDLGATEVQIGKKTLTVSYSESERSYLDQDKAKRIILAAGKKVPQMTTTLVSFKIKS